MIEHKRELWALLVVLVLSNLFVATFVARERYLYYFDYVGYWSSFVEVTRSFAHDVPGTLRRVIESIRTSDYNAFPIIFLLPAGLIFGTTRMAYVLLVANLYALPAIALFASVHGAFSQRLGLSSRAVAVVPFAVVLLLPNFWTPILYGLPDVGGVILINVILLLFLRRPYLESRMRDLLLIAALIALLTVFRRWYAYWGVAFYVSLLIVESVSLAVARTLKLDMIAGLCARVGLQGAVSGATLLLIAPVLVLRGLGSDYSDLYSAFRSSESLLWALLRLVREFGLLFFSLFVIGGVLALLSTRARKLSSFLLLQWGVIFVLFSRTQDIGYHHAYMLMPTMLLFSCVPLTKLWQEKGLSSSLLALGLAVALAFNWLGYFFPTPWTESRVARAFTSAVNHVPFVRNDIPEVDRLLGVLAKVAASPGDRIYVLASSPILNCHILRYAHLTLRRHEAVGRKILWTHDVDKRDGFPRQFLTAQYLVVADPIQHHLRVQEQQIVIVLAESILLQRNVGRYFVRLPNEFTLGDGAERVRVYIYKKTSELQNSDLDALSEALRVLYPDRENIYRIARVQR